MYKMPLQKQKQTVIVNIGDVAIKKKRKPRTTKPKPKPKKPKKPPASAVRRIATAEGARQEQFIYPIQPRYNEVAPTLAATRQPMPTPPPTLAPAPTLAPPPTQTEKAILPPATTINLAGERAIQRDNERIIESDTPPVISLSPRIKKIQDMLSRGLGEMPEQGKAPAPAFEMFPEFQTDIELGEFFNKEKLERMASEKSLGDI